MTQKAYQPPAHAPRPAGDVLNDFQTMKSAAGYADSIPPGQPPHASLPPPGQRGATAPPWMRMYNAHAALRCDRARSGTDQRGEAINNYMPQRESKTAALPRRAIPRLALGTTGDVHDLLTMSAAAAGLQLTLRAKIEIPSGQSSASDDAAS
ncbi:uncharacterized protein TrAFT101_001792 [Trichoderma asperellum]|uniref:uncharacterized protein n=1 Tax=Trichoderma asperellum TaxID=101201 RepID=UPI00332CAF81|nr:hypothetical protein TrAFT101_001792 [Trichoderma asperellum]